MDVREQIRSYVVENFLFGDEAPLTDDAVSLLDNGIIDSTGVMELVAFLEGDLELEVGDDDLVPENLDSIANLVGYVERKRAVA